MSLPPELQAALGGGDPFGFSTTDDAGSEDPFLVLLQRGVNNALTAYRSSPMEFASNVLNDGKVFATEVENCPYQFIIRKAPR